MTEREKPIENSVGEKEVVIPPPQPSKPSGLDKLLESPDTAKAVLRAVEAYEKSIEIKAAAASGAGKRFLCLSIIFFIAVLVGVIFLTYTDKLSPEATAFLLGVIATGAIAIIRDFTNGEF